MDLTFLVLIIIWLISGSGVLVFGIPLLKDYLKKKKELKILKHGDIREGRIEFGVGKGKVKWNDNRETVLFNITVNGGNLFMIKDKDNKLKFSHIFVGKGRTDVEVDAFNLPFDESHHIEVRWSLKEKKVTLCVDGDKLKVEKPINYTI